MRLEEGERLRDDPPCPRDPRMRVSASSDLVSNSRSPRLDHWQSGPLPPLLLPWRGLILHCMTSFVGVALLIHPVQDKGAKPATNSWPNLLMMHFGMGRRIVVDYPTLYRTMSLITSYHLRYYPECAGTFYLPVFMTKTNDCCNLNTTRNRDSNPGPSKIPLTY